MTIIVRSNKLNRDLPDFSSFISALKIIEILVSTFYSR
jgi:hypothetical protein